MLLKYFYDKSLAHASYLVGCPRSSEALVVDPARNVEPYLEAAFSEGLRIVGAAETHIHADFVSGARELADRVGARLYLSDEGPANWKYLFADPHNATLVKHGDKIQIGNLELEVVHTPGHTPEHISFLLTDKGGGADSPMGIFTGDFVFVGSIGRPDLLETAAGIAGSADTGARQLFHSMRKFRELPGHLQVWPAHGAGSACGKGLGAIPSSTVGYEKLFNPALQFQDEQQFVDYILADQPETPVYFARMKHINKVGPELLRNLSPVPALAVDLLPTILRHGLTIDVSPAAEFAAGHVPATINVPLNMLVQWAGFLVDYSQPLYILVESSGLPEVLKRLRSIGIDNVAGSFDATAVKLAGLRTEAYRSLPPQELQRSIERGEVKLLDVRAGTEFREGHIAGAEHRFLGQLMRDIEVLDRSRPVVAQCQAGGRSAIAASILQRAEFDVTNMSGGYKAWVAAGFPVTRDDARL
ncbi:MAG: rhodanese-like domain-containing protein [Pirellulaceae bacterium]